MTIAATGPEDGGPRGPGGPRGSAPVPRDPYGIGPVGGWVGPILAIAGLGVVAWLTLAFLTGDVRLPAGSSGNGPPGGPDGRTPAPSNVVVVDPRADVPGSIVYVKAGNVWVQSGTSVRQLTRSGSATNPAWSADGEWIYYVQSKEEVGFFPARGQDRRYTMQVPTLLRTRSDGSGEPEPVASGRIKRGRYSWFFWIRQPAVSPDGSTIAVVSDGPDPTERNVVLQLLDAETGEFTVPDVPESPPLGHQDPAWRPNGEHLLFVRNGTDDAGRGTPSIWRLNPATGRSSALTGPGYLAPAWSRDGRWIAATRTTTSGTDVVILDARNGAEVFRVTTDGRSFSPVWSPVGDGVAFLHQQSGIVDLRLATLGGTAPRWEVTETINLTEVSGLEATSRPGWFVPAGDLPPLPTSAPSGAAGTAAPASPAPGAS